jgi:hypothetical protein
MLVDDTGAPLKKGLSKEEVTDRLRALAPKNKEEEVLLARRVAELLEHNRQDRMRRVLKNDTEGIFRENAKKRLQDDNWTPTRQYRRIASIPKDMVYVAEKIWGPDVLTDKKKFKEAFVKDETGKYCLTVDPDTI